MDFLRRLRGTVEPSWWAASGTPPRQGCIVTPLVDGHQTMLAMCRAFVAARESIVLAAWDIRADLPMVRGADTEARPDGDERQRANFQALGDAGLSAEDIAFWNSGDLTVKSVLAHAISRGVKVYLLLWDALGVSHLTNDPKAQAAALSEVGVNVLLDASCHHVTSAIRALHQKCAVVDGSVAFVGGVDLTSQETGDYDRWDTNHHPCFSDERVLDTLPGAHPWHDVHARLEGPIVADVLANVAQRWNDEAARQKLAPWPSALSSPVSAPIRGGITAQIVRTIPPGIYASIPEGAGTIYEVYLAAMRQAKRAIYIESQYLWRDVFLGLDNQLWGPESPHMRAIISELASALRRGVSVVIVLPDHPNTGRVYSDGGIEMIRKLAKGADRERLRVLTLGTSEIRNDERIYRPVYVHAKVCIIDDAWWTAGSANLNSRGMHGDAEINVVALDPATATRLRIALWEEHMHPSAAELAQMSDSARGADLLWRRAQENASKVAAGEPMQGHLLPYFTHSEATSRHIRFSHEHGWLDALKALNAQHAHHAERYL